MLFYEVGSTLITMQEVSEKMTLKAWFKKKTYNVSHSELNFLQHVRFRITNITTPSNFEEFF